MIDKGDFEKKQIIFYFPANGDKMSFRNDNILITDRDGKIKFQSTCYRIFLIFVAGDTTITTGLLQRANKFGFSLCLMNRNLKVYRHINARMEGNTLLRKRQYEYDELDLAKYIVANKIGNQKAALMKIRKKTPGIKEAINILEEHLYKLDNEVVDLNEIMGIEGSAARSYFPQIFSNTAWKSRRPRIKADYINACLDIGYTILFNIVDGLVNVYGFDEYRGVLHRCFYMRKSLVCDLMEPFRPIVDWTIRKAINLEQFRQEDFQVYNGKYQLDWKKSGKYTQILLEGLLEYKIELFSYIQSYYRAFMKHKAVDEFPIFQM
ncbi:MAG: type V CRISPR-associated endonuclease Cas1 [Lachnoclostridium sp.]|nr:type V CRISPR-associated endonuclease Cas1 [Lachnospira sp.]MCM1247144.1 type V CRISPR-associated endonuclease Cas1 [Lachnoclostridium sp.]